MKTVSTILFALLSLVGFSGVASAYGEPPPGSYQRTCRNIETDGRRISANCQTRYGSWSYSTLDNYRDCRSDIVNNNGQLECERGRGDEDDHDSDRLPQGSYQRTCRSGEADRHTLSAECQDRYGRWRYTELEDYRQCRGDIANNNGVLQCRGGDDQYDDDDGDRDLPRGDWRSSCRNYHMYGTVLRAECRDRYGRYVQSSIDVRQCRRDVSNYGGRLVCGNGGAGGGSGPGRIILYKHTDFGGKTRVYTGDVPDLNQQAFGHTASSAVVQGGVWQLCDQTYYRGNCIIVDRAERNFNSIGFNDRAESLRRVR